MVNVFHSVIFITGLKIEIELEKIFLSRRFVFIRRQKKAIILKLQNNCFVSVVKTAKYIKIYFSQIKESQRKPKKPKLLSIH